MRCQCGAQGASREVWVPGWWHSPAGVDVLQGWEGNPWGEQEEESRVWDGEGAG